MISYEWCLNSTDEHGDIHDIHHFEVTVRDTRLMLSSYHPDGNFNDIELSVIWGNDEDGITDRCYAPLTYHGDRYPTLPDTFNGGHKVPKSIKRVYDRAIELTKEQRQ